MLKQMNKWFAAMVLIAGISVPAMGQVINERSKLLPIDGVGSGAFGRAVIAVDGSTLVVGAYKDAQNGLDAGAVYVFDLLNDKPIMKLLPSDGQSSDWFGITVAIDNGLIVVGAPLNDNLALDAGAVYVFDAKTGVQLRKIVTPDSFPREDNFGISVAIEGDILVVGQSHNGSGTVFLFDAKTGQTVTELSPGGSSSGGGCAGCIVAIRGDTVAVSQKTSGFSGYLGAGEVVLYHISTGTEYLRLFPKDISSNDNFGSSIALGEGVVAVGSFRDDDESFDSGSAYLFSSITGEQLLKVIPGDGISQGRFGSSVGVLGDGLVVGAVWDDDNGEFSGSAYVFDQRTEEKWKLLPSDGEELDLFGSSIVISGDIVIVGAPGDDDLDSASGAVYIYDLSCAADFTGDGVLDSSDVHALLDLFVAQDPTADFTADGIFNLQDIFAYLALFNAGCPLSGSGT
ncbi:MAG: FG-GAP repeat protein [Phycisphaerales bacterium]|nr:FG-GAP repeat protein [Phycisphaerales bacterium]